MKVNYVPGHTLLGIVSVGAAELREKDTEGNVDERMSMHVFASSEVVPLENEIAQTS